MKRLEWDIWVSILLFSVMNFALIGCAPGGNGISAGPNDSAGAESLPPNSAQIQKSVDGKVYLRKDGWPIPSLSGAKKDEEFERILDSQGRSVTISGTTFLMQHPFPITKEPFASIGYNFGKIQIHKILEYRTPRGVFCYKFEANRVTVEEGSNRIVSTEGVIFSYSYYDEDGDGIYESLYVSETDKSGRISNVPHIPQWLL